jgi:hypothetical protein
MKEQVCQQTKQPADLELILEAKKAAVKILKIASKILASTPPKVLKRAIGE